jgi:AcrR family transcriptional regulator
MIDRLAATGRLRALDAQEKAARRESLLDAAERLYEPSLQLPAVGEVASEAGMAKGTVYLYFRSREALYLGLHERQAQRFFDDLAQRLSQPGPFDQETMLAIVDAHMIRRPAFLSLCNACMAAQADAVDEATHEAFHLALGTTMAQVGTALERHLPRLQPGDGVRFLHQGYALLLGLHQLVGQPSQAALLQRLQARAAGLGRPMGLLAMSDFRTEAHAALRGLWQQAQTWGLVPPERLSPG